MFILSGCKLKYCCFKIKFDVSNILFNLIGLGEGVVIKTDLNTTLVTVQ